MLIEENKTDKIYLKVLALCWHYTQLLYLFNRLFLRTALAL